MPPCKHLNTATGEPLPFLHGVAERTEDMNEAAHGGVRFWETCLDCGKSRWVLHNQGHEEYGLWHEGLDP